MTRAFADCDDVEMIEQLAEHKIFMKKRRNVINFGAGPAKLPEAVMYKAQTEFREYQHTGIGVLEMSHRSKEFADIIGKTKSLFRHLLHIPNDYDVILMQGGGTGQFAAAPLNLMSNSKSEPPTADYMVTGEWSSKAAREGAHFLNTKLVFKPEAFTTIPDVSEWQLDPNAAYTYYCANETVHGVEFHETPNVETPLIADMSSNIMSRPVEINKHGVIFAGTQKNIGAAGLTVAIVRHDLITQPHKMCPSVMSYQTLAKAESVYNTPPVYSIYLTKLVLEWIRDQGGVEEMERLNKIKSETIYNVIEDSNGFYRCPIDERNRSRMNVPFRVGGQGGNEEIEKEFLEVAADRHMISLKGHRSVGGIRASLYNAITIPEVMRLADYMIEFQQKHADGCKSIRD